MRESDIQKLTMIKLSSDDCTVFRTNAGKFRSMDGKRIIQGLPLGHFDLYGFKHVNGKVFYIEMKTKTGKARESQINFHKMLSHWGIIHGIARSPEDAVKIVDEELVGYGFNHDD